MKKQTLMAVALAWCGACTAPTTNHATGGQTMGETVFESGSDGAETPELLTVVEDEPPGTECAEGGVVVRVGHDLNGDGALDPREVASTTYVCGEGAADEVYEGNLVITDDSDLLALKQIRVVAGALRMVGTDVQHLDVLSHLEVVQGDLEISGNALLENVDGLSRLTSVGGDVVLTDNAVSTYAGLDQLVTVGEVLGGDLIVSPYAPTVDGFAGLERVVGQVALHVAEGELGGFSSLRQVGALHIVGSEDAPTTLTGMGQLEVVARDVFLSDVAVDLSFLSGIEALGGDLTLLRVDGLSGLDHLRRVDGTLLVEGTHLGQLTFEGLETIGVGLNLRQLTEDLPAFPALTHVGGDLTVEEVEGDLTGLEALEHVGGDVWIDDLHGSLSGLNSLSQVMGGVEAYVDGTISGLNGLESVQHQLVVYARAGDVTGLDALVEVGGSMTVLHTGVLLGLTHLEHVSGSLSLWATSSEVVGVFEALEHVGGALSVRAGGDVDAFHNLQEAQEVSVVAYGMDGHRLSGFGALTSLVGLELRVTAASYDAQAGFVEVDAFGALQKIEQDLRLYRIDENTVISPLTALTSVGRLLLDFKTALDDFDWLPAVDHLGAVEVDPDALTDEATVCALVARVDQVDEPPSMVCP